MCRSALPTHTHREHKCAWCLQRSEKEGTGTGVRDGCVLGTKLGFSARAVSTFNCWAIIPPPNFFFYISNPNSSMITSKIKKKTNIYQIQYLTGPLLFVLHLSYSLCSVYSVTSSSTNTETLSPKLHTWELSCLGSSTLPGDSLLALYLSVMETTLPEGLNLLEKEHKGDQ